MVCNSGKHVEPRALIIEDDHATVTLLEAVLARESIACDHAENGASALQMMSRAEYGAVLLDLVLPVVDGFAVLRDVRSQRPALLTSIVVMTAAADSVWRGCEEIRMVRCLLRKPLDIGELVSHVRRCMSAGVLRQA